MTILKLTQLQLIDFVLVDSDGAMVPGLGSGFILEISKNGGDFLTGTGVKAEIGYGWYSYQLTTAETDTQGPLAVRITGPGIDQQNLVYQVSGSAIEVPAGPNILSTAEAAAILRCDENDPSMVIMLPWIDADIRRRTGRDWSADLVIHPLAKRLATLLLVKSHEDPGDLNPNQGTAISAGILAATIQLQVEALYYHTFEGLTGPGSIEIRNAKRGDSVLSLYGRVGATGDQAAKFETVIQVDGYLQQIASEDLTLKFYTAHLVPPGEI
jgi:hypothetical protein